MTVGTRLRTAKVCGNCATRPKVAQRWMARSKDPLPFRNAKPSAIAVSLRSRQYPFGKTSSSRAKNRIAQVALGPMMPNQNVSTYSPQVSKPAMLTTGSIHSETNISLLEKSQRFEFITVCVHLTSTTVQIFKNGERLDR